tara:strand:+ start:848 stop:1147 length:300 start_codon:yes stop_codon:yes gene_type:complete
MEEIAKQINDAEYKPLAYTALRADLDYAQMQLKSAQVEDGALSIEVTPLNRFENQDILEHSVFRPFGTGGLRHGNVIDYKLQGVSIILAASDSFKSVTE